MACITDQESASVDVSVERNALVDSPVEDLVSRRFSGACQSVRRKEGERKILLHGAEKVGVDVFE